MQFPHSRIALFAKAPEAGKVKTRLLPAVSAVEAADLYAGMLKHTVEKLVQAGVAAVDCWCAPDQSHPLFQSLAEEHGITLRQQQGADLGQRMMWATEVTLAEAESLVLIGGDCPVLTPCHLEQALERLSAGDDAVVAPAEDGGYVMLGLKRCHPALFTQMPWGSDRVLGLTRQRLQALGWQWSETEMLWDLDRPEDLLRYRRLAL